MSPLVSSDSGILNDNFASVAPNTCVAFGVLGTCLIFGISDMVWPPVKQFSANVVGWDMELRVGGAVGGCWNSFRGCYLALGGVLPWVTRTSLDVGKTEIFC